MNILIINDDGYTSSLTMIINNLIRKKGHRVISFLPNANCSGTGTSITIGNYSYELLAMDEFCVRGTPIDCFNAGYAWCFKNNIKLDLVLSGINSGLNLGQSIRYSGTVNSAIEATLRKLPSIAISVSKSIEINNQLKFYLELLTEHILGKKLLEILSLKILCVNINIVNINTPSAIYLESKICDYENYLFDIDLSDTLITTITNKNLKVIDKKEVSMVIGVIDQNYIYNNEYGKIILNALKEELKVIERYSSRAVILNSDGKILLFEFIQNRIQGDVAWWVFPGGGLEDKETFEEAIYREIEEETGVVTKEPIKWIWERDILLNGKKGPLLSHERFYLIHLDIANISLDNFTENEKKTFKNYKWFTLEELKTFTGNMSVSQTYELIKAIINNEMIEYPIKIGE